MDLSAWRDIILIIWGLVASAGIVFIAVMMFLFYRKMTTLLESADLMVARASELMDYVNNEVIRPAGRFGTMVQGIIQGVNIFRSIFNKKEDKDE